MDRLIGQGGRESTVFGRSRVFIDAWLSRVRAAAVSKNRSAEDVGNYTLADVCLYKSSQSM